MARCAAQVGKPPEARKIERRDYGGEVSMPKPCMPIRKFALRFFGLEEMGEQRAFVRRMSGSIDWSLR